MERVSKHKEDFCILLALWGSDFIHNFLELSLLSLLAPGNIPVLKDHFNHVRFVFLTKEKDIDQFAKYPQFKKLANHCSIEFVAIDDLIVAGLHSVTLTKAYDRAMQACGEHMLNTYFMFLTADFIMADGSLRGLIRYIKQGFSGICAGNFQVRQEEIKPFLRSHIDSDDYVLTINARELLRQGLSTLHPVTIANHYNQQIVHNEVVNRFFLRADTDVLIGRFFLLHMLCIKPETTSYRVGASCDYAFLPEMCPSGNIGIITDSDDYFVVEIQDELHELEHIKLGPYQIDQLVPALAGWTTQEHRQFVQTNIWFHTRDISAAEKDTLQQPLHRFIQQITKALSSYPVQPAYHHPFWLSALHYYEQSHASDKQLDYVNDIADFKASILKRIFYFCFGLPPKVHFWHHRWVEHDYLRYKITSWLSDPAQCLVFFDKNSPYHSYYQRWLQQTLGVKLHYYVKPFLQHKTIVTELKTNKIKQTLLFVDLDNLDAIQQLLVSLQDILGSDGQVLLVVSNGQNHRSKLIYSFQKEFMNKMTAIFNSQYKVDQMTIMQNNAMHFLSRMQEIIAMRAKNKILRWFCYACVAVPSGLYVCLYNTYKYLFKRQSGYCTGLILTLSALGKHTNA